MSQFDSATALCEEEKGGKKGLPCVAHVGLSQDESRCTSAEGSNAPFILSAE